MRASWTQPWRAHQRALPLLPALPTPRHPPVNVVHTQPLQTVNNIHSFVKLPHPGRLRVPRASRPRGTLRLSRISRPHPKSGRDAIATRDWLRGEERIDAMSNQKYLNIGNADHPVTVWWSPTQPDRVHVTTSDTQFTDENGEKAGLRVVFSSNPRSADYNPGNFNRVARALEGADIPAPSPVPMHPRHLRSRSQVIAEAAAEGAHAEATAALGQIADALSSSTMATSSGVTVQDPAEFGWSVCQACSAVVVDLQLHSSHGC